MNLSRNKDIIPEKTEDLLLMKKTYLKYSKFVKLTNIQQSNVNFPNL